MDQARTGWLARRYAHRGLHGHGLIENSCAAFEAAIAAGDGIELDVQPSRDNIPFVFHDAQLDRLTHATGPIVAQDAATLGQVTLRGEGGPLYRLDETLAFIAGRVPVLVEIKAQDRGTPAWARAVADAIAGYAGPLAVMSFDPQVIRWFARHCPAVTRGLVVTEEHRRGLRGKTARWLAFCWARPDFLAYDIRDLPSAFAAYHRARGVPVLTWTVRDDALARRAALYSDGPIYERR